MILQVYKIIPILLIRETPDKLGIIIGLSLNRAFIREDNILPIYITSPVLYKLTSFFGILLFKMNVLFALLFLQVVFLQRFLDGGFRGLKGQASNEDLPGLLRALVNTLMDISLLIRLQLFRTTTFRKVLSYFVEGEVFWGVVNYGVTDIKFCNKFDR